MFRVRGHIEVDGVIYSYEADLGERGDDRLIDILYVKGPDGREITDWDYEFDPQPTDENVRSRKVFKQLHQLLFGIIEYYDREQYEA